MSFMILSLILFLSSAHALNSDNEKENTPQNTASKKRKLEAPAKQKQWLLHIGVEFCKDNFNKTGAPSSNTPWRSCLVFDNTHQQNKLLFGFCVQDSNQKLELEQIIRKYLKSLNETVYLFETSGEMKVNNGIVTFPSLENKSLIRQDFYVYEIQSSEV